MGPARAAAEEGTLIEEARGQHEDARMAAVVGQQGSSMSSGGLPERFVVGEEPFNERSTKTVLPCYFVVDGHLRTNLGIGSKTKHQCPQITY